MRFPLPIALLVCLAASSHASALEENPISVALVPIDGELNEDQRRLLDAALRAELQVGGTRLLAETERLTHVRGARSLGLGCQAEASPACLCFIAEVAGLSEILVGSAENGRIRMARYRFVEGAITERIFAEADIPTPGASYVRTAQTLLQALHESPSGVHGVQESSPASVTSDGSSKEVPILGTASMPALESEKNTHPSLANDAMAESASSSSASAVGSNAPLVWSSLSTPVVLGGATVLTLGVTSWALSQWIARTPLTSQVTGSKSVGDRLQLIDTTESIGLAMIVSGALLTSAGGALSLWPETSPE